MSTFGDLIGFTQKLLDDTAGWASTPDEIRRELEHGELLIAMLRADQGAERTQDLTLSANTPVYEIHTVQSNAFSDFIYPVRCTINNLPVLPTDFGTVLRLYPDWYTTTSAQPEGFFMIGADHIAFRDVPNGSMTAKLTYIRVPPTSQATSASPIIDQDYHEVLPYYASAVLLAKEGDISNAEMMLTRFSELAGVPRDPRYLPGASQQSPVTHLEEAQRGSGA